MAGADVAGGSSQVAEVLACAASLDPGLVKSATEQLRQWERQPGFFAAVVAAASDASLSDDARMVAGTVLRRGAEAYWRGTARGGISDEEKRAIREQIVFVLGEPNSRLAGMLAAVIAKMARFDVPAHWPALVPLLLDNIRNPNRLTQTRALEVLYRVIKEMASRRLVSARRLFEEVSQDILPYVVPLWLEVHDAALAQVQAAVTEQEVQAVYELLEFGRLVLKTIRQLLSHGCADFHTLPIAVEALESVGMQLNKYLPLYNMLAPVDGHPLLEVTEKILALQTKTILDVLHHHPISFSNFLVDIMSTILDHILNPDHDQEARPTRFLTMCFNLIHHVLNCSEYVPLRSGRHSDRMVQIQTESGAVKEVPAEAVEAKERVDQAFTPDVLNSLCRVIINKHLVMGTDDMELWESDPEAYPFDRVGITPITDMRAAAEQAMLTIVHNYTSVVGPTFAELLQSAQAPAENAEHVLFKEAAYRALGVCAYDLYDVINFDSWFCGSLYEELATPNPDIKYVRQRGLAVVAAWIPVRMSKDSRPRLYELLAKIIASDDDLVVRLQAVATLRTAADDFDFDSDAFAPYALELMLQLIQLLQNLSETDSKIQVLECLREVVGRSSDQIQASVEDMSQLLVPLQDLWAHSSEYPLLQGVLLGSLADLADTMGQRAHMMAPFLYGVIDASTNIELPGHVYMMESGLKLWHSMLQSAAALDESLMILYRRMPSLLDRAEDDVRLCMNITRSYVLLDPSAFLTEYGGVLSACLQALLGGLQRHEDTKSLCLLMDTIVACFPRNGPELLRESLLQILVVVSEGKSIQAAHSAWSTLLHRVLLLNPEYFAGLMQEASTRFQMDMMGEFWKSWMDKFDCYAEPKQRKLRIMALAVAVGDVVNHGEYVSAYFARVMDAFASALCEFHLDEDTTVTEKDKLHYYIDVLADLQDDEEVAPETRRIRKFSFSDPVYTTNLAPFVTEKLQEFAVAVGSEQYEAMRAALQSEPFAAQLQTFGL